LKLLAFSITPFHLTRILAAFCPIICFHNS
jgi:hypothetical protein